MTIPKCLHFIWFQGKDSVPEDHVQRMQTFRTLNPEWEIAVWDRASIGAACAGLGDAVARAFDRLPSMMTKIEFGRYVALFSRGGVSIDMDMVCCKPLEAVPGMADDASLILSKMNASPLICRYASLGRYGSLLNNAFIACEPRHPFMQRVLDFVVAHRSSGWLWTRVLPTLLPSSVCTVHVTGCIVLVDLYDQYTRYLGETDSSARIRVLPHSVVELDRVDPKDPDQVICHHHHLSWVSAWERRLRDFLSAPPVYRRACSSTSYPAKTD